MFKREFEYTGLKMDGADTEITVEFNGGKSSSSNSYIYPYPWTEPSKPYDWYPSTTTTILTNEKRCTYCDGRFCKTPEQCPRVKSISYYKDGSISKIEFHKVDDE